MGTRWQEIFSNNFKHFEMSNEIEYIDKYEDYEQPEQTGRDYDEVWREFYGESMYILFLTNCLEDGDHCMAENDYCGRQRLLDFMEFDGLQRLREFREQLEHYVNTRNQMRLKLERDE